jgi:hypothetical protein
MTQGFWPVYFRIGPHTILTFMFYEKLLSLVDDYYDATSK